MKTQIAVWLILAFMTSSLAFRLHIRQPLGISRPLSGYSKQLRHHHRATSSRLNAIQLKLPSFGVFSFIKNAFSKAASRVQDYIDGVDQVAEKVYSYDIFRPAKIMMDVIVVSIPTSYFIFTIIRYELQKHAKEKERQRMAKLLPKFDKENMYIDAVRDMLSVIKNPSTSSSARNKVQQELRALDPKQEITKFVMNQGPRPDLSYLIKKPRNYQAEYNAEEEEKYKNVAYCEQEQQFANVLDKLRTALKGKLAQKKFEHLLESLQKRFTIQASRAKRAEAMKKIEERINDIGYWKNLANTI